MPIHERSFDFDALLSPLGAETFFSTYWERQHLLLRRSEPAFYDPLIRASDLETLISDTDTRYPAIRLAKGGGYFPAETYTRDIRHGDESFLGVPDVNRITEEYRRGATIALPAIHRTWKPIGLLCDALGTRFDHPAHANAYITPGNAAGFTPHYDVHEVFVLQIAGKKCWSIYAPVLALPHRSQPFTPKVFAGAAPIAQVDLEAGDLLYLPRGFIHSTTTTESFSAHVTVGVTVYTWVDLIKEFLASAVQDEELRHALPVGFASRDDIKPRLRETMLAGLDKMRARIGADKLIDTFTNRIRIAQVPRPVPFRADVTVIDLESVLQMPSPEQFAITQENDMTMLTFKGTRYQLPAPVAATLRDMGLRRSFKGTDLPNHLDNDGKLGLIRHLADINFLTVVRINSL